LRQLEEFFNGAWSIFEVLDMNFADRGYHLDEMLRFVIRVDSQSYPQIYELYERRIETWATDRRAELDIGYAARAGGFGLSRLTARSTD
jgi:hypothetical protein